MKGVFLVLISFRLFAGQDDNAKVIQNQVFRSDLVESGRLLFRDACSACHGPNGGGGHGPSLAEGERVRSLNDTELFHSIQKGVPGTDMPPAPMSEPQIRQVMAFVRSLSAPAIESAAIGDSEAGAALFFGKAGCVSCHMIHGNGGLLGPDLSDAGNRMTVNQLRNSILKPGSNIAQGFQGITVVTKGGKTIQGIAKNQDNYSIQLLDSQGHLYLLARADLATIELSTRSLMPSDFGSRLTSIETNSIISFLSRQSVRPRNTK